MLSFVRLESPPNEPYQVGKEVLIHCNGRNPRYSHLDPPLMYYPADKKGKIMWEDEQAFEASSYVLQVKVEEQPDAKK